MSGQVPVDDKKTPPTGAVFGIAFLAGPCDCWAWQKDGEPEWHWPYCRRVPASPRPLSSKNETLRAEILAVIPDNWLHPLLSGPHGIIRAHQHPVTPKQVERLLQELRFEMSHVLDKHGIKG